MIKNLLSVSLLSALALGANAYNVDEYVYTKTARYQIAGDNIVTNGQFKQGATGTTGWNAIDETAAPLTSVFTVKEGGPNGSNTQMVLDGQTALTAGMYQKIGIEQGGTYVVTLRVMGATAGFTDLDLNGASTNYINAYYNTDGALATVTQTTVNKVTTVTLHYGEGGVSGGYGFSFSNDGFTEVSFAIDAPAGGFIMIDLRGLNAGLEIGDVECHLAKSVYDNRVAERRVAYINKIISESGVDMSSKELYGDLTATLDELKNAIEENASAEDMQSYMENLDGVWTEFLATNFSNVIDVIPTTDGTAATGNNSANWMNWKGKWNKLNPDYKNKAPWSWSTDRWCAKGNALGSPMCIQWMRAASGNWDNIATLTATLDKGTYFWGVSADGGMMTLNKNRWARSWARDCAATQLFFNGDTTDVFVLDPAVSQDYVYRFDIKEDSKEITLGIRCNSNLEGAAAQGFDVHFNNPVLYKLHVDGEWTPEQKAYIDAVNVQLEALKGRIDVANGYLAADQTAMPWGKEALKEGVEEAQIRYDKWAALSEEEILDYQDNFETLSDTIMNNGVRFLNNNYINVFTALNKPLTDMPTAIAAATSTKNERIYSGSTKMAELEAAIKAAQSLYEEKLKVAYSKEDSTALADEKISLENTVEAFKAAIEPVNLIDIDFGTQEAPASIVKHEDATGETETYYSIAGKKGEMITAVGEGTTAFGLGYNGTDSLGILRIGNGEATVAVKDAPNKASDIVNVKFDFYVGNLTKGYAGFYLMTEEGDTITGLYWCKYDGKAEYNPMNIDFNNKINGVGSSAESNAAIAAEKNRTHFDIVIDYGAKTVYCTTSGTKGTAKTEAIPMTTDAPLTKFVLKSNYTTDARRCWFDNLVIDNIAAEPTAINGVSEATNASADDAIYNVAGQKVTSPVKGQIYIKKGAAFVK